MNELVGAANLMHTVDSQPRKACWFQQCMGGQGKLQLLHESKTNVSFEDDRIQKCCGNVVLHGQPANLHACGKWLIHDRHVFFLPLSKTHTSQKKQACHLISKLIGNNTLNDLQQLVMIIQDFVVMNSNFSF